MAREVITTVNLWDDIHAAAGEQVEATESVVIELDGQRVSLDLTTGHRAELGELLAPWLAAGTPVTVSQPAARRSAATTATGANGGINGPEHAALRAAIRTWAESVGRMSEIKVPRKDGAGFTLIYPKQLRADFDAAMAAQAQAAAKPETAETPAEAPKLAVVPAEAPVPAPAPRPATRRRRTDKDS